jgi:hypothetical protein
MRFAWAVGLLAAPALFGQASPCEGTKIYSSCEVVFDLPAAGHPNPYASVDLRIEFRSPRRRTLAMPAFWDGGRRMIVRFAPTEAGPWDYHVTSNVAEWNDKQGSFTAAAAESQGFIMPANVHHWRYTEMSAGLYQAHLWMGSTEPGFATMDDAAFRAMADARADQKFTHVRGVVLADGAYASGMPSPEFFKRLDARVRYLNDKGIVTDLVLAGPGTLTKLFGGAEERKRFVRYLVARYSAFNVTWQGVERFEEYADGRALLREVGGYLKELDPYQHPRTTGGRVTSSVLLDDGWMNFVLHSTSDRNVNAIEHQLYSAPFVNVAPEQEDAGAFRRRLWNGTMDGQYMGIASAPDAAKAKVMSVWFDILKDTRYWELEPYFDVDGGRAVALEDTEYLVYVEKPGPIELTVEKHGYEVFWIDPATGESVKSKKKFSGEHFTIEPPDKSHDWVLHVVREGRVEGMNRSYKFESRKIVLQEVEANSPKVPFTIEAPKTELSVTKALPYEAKVTRESRATRAMLYLWTGDVAADKQGYRVLATGAKGDMKVPADIAKNYPATMHLRLYGMNANGKVYELDSALDLKQ